MNFPENLQYSKEHEWVRIDGDVAVVGITEFAVSQLGDVTLVEGPAVGAVIAADTVVGTIESVKAVSDLFSPVGGTVEALNTDLEDEPEKVNDDAYEAGWIFRVRIDAPPAGLMDAAAYRAYIQNLE